MLVLTRELQQSLVIGDNRGTVRQMRVTVLAIRGSRVMLGIDVGNEVEVRRWEIWKQIQAGVTGDTGSFKTAEQNIRKNTRD